MAEKLTPNHSKETLHHPEAAGYSIERARKSLEQRAKQQEGGEKLEAIRERVEKHATPAERPSHQTEKEKQRVSVSDKKHAYKQTMHRVQSKLNPVSRQFSRLVHAPVVEAVSESAAKTIARPSGIIGGGLTASIGLGIALVLAQRNGFALSGSELWILLAIGWVAGIVFEFAGRALRRS